MMFFYILPWKEDEIPLSAGIDKRESCNTSKEKLKEVVISDNFKIGWTQQKSLSFMDTVLNRGTLCGWCSQDLRRSAAVCVSAGTSPHCSGGLFGFLLFQHSSIAAQFTNCSHCYGSTETVVCLSKINITYSNDTWYFRVISEWCKSK